jgi:hypothetical protein
MIEKYKYYPIIQLFGTIKKNNCSKSDLIRNRLYLLFSFQNGLNIEMNKYPHRQLFVIPLNQDSFN